MIELSRTVSPYGLEATMLATPALRQINGTIAEWLADDDNISIDDGRDNYGVFEYEYDGVYTGHYFFRNARGKYAIELSKDILHLMFLLYGAKLIRGLTPTSHKAALWMNRRLGFKSQGIVDSHVGPLEVFTLAKEDL